ncbi:MAG: hypothetical protein JNN08_24705 [Bryobacterales bacterium]|nr:hypothetical protein [Bryobacterales bacterium]
MMQFNPLQVVKTNWKAGDQREVEDWRIERQEGVEYDSYRRVYLADAKEWVIVGQIMKENGRKYYILECME